MMTIRQLTQHITERAHFKTIQEYEGFAMAFLDFVEGGLQARIVCQKAELSDCAGLVPHMNRAFVSPN